MSSMMVQKRSPYRFLGLRLIEPSSESSACGVLCLSPRPVRAAASPYLPILTIASGLERPL
jgi:hypothetical protein